MPRPSSTLLCFQDAAGRWCLVTGIRPLVGLTLRVICRVGLTDPRRKIPAPPPVYCLANRSFTFPKAFPVTWPNSRPASGRGNLSIPVPVYEGVSPPRVGDP